MANSKARQLRSTMTDAEQVLWRRLRNKQLFGNRFRRQVPIGSFVADFACLKARLVIEIDGGQHEGNAKDIERDAWFAEQVPRDALLNSDVLRNMDGV
jgi:very-short-patch-repair endonuclease